MSKTKAVFCTTSRKRATHFMDSGGSISPGFKRATAHREEPGRGGDDGAVGGGEDGARGSSLGTCDVEEH